MSYVDPSSLNESYVQGHNAQTCSKIGSNSHHTNATNSESASHEVVGMGLPKSESKNHKWKEAPMMGVE